MFKISNHGPVPAGVFLPQIFNEGTICMIPLQAISKFESLMNQVQKNAKDINNRLSAIEKTVLFKRPPKKNGILYPDAKVMDLLQDFIIN